MSYEMFREAIEQYDTECWVIIPDGYAGKMAIAQMFKGIPYAICNDSLIISNYFDCWYERGKI